MAWTAAVLLLSLLFRQGLCLQCNTCQGEYDCVGESVTCKDPWASCTTSVRKASVSFMEFQTIRKGCARQLYPQESISLHSHMMALSYQSRFCSEDRCNNETYFISHPAPTNHMRCHTCATQGPACLEGARSQMSCVGDQDQCVTLDITGHAGLLSNLKLRGCASLPHCQETLSFYSGTRTIQATCCDTPLCNSFIPDLHLHSQATNGLECYSCTDGEGFGSGCSNGTLATIQCTSIHNMCLEGTGKSRKGNKDLGIMAFKGCASEAMCQSPLLALVQELDDVEVLCCQGNLCNSRIVNGIVTGSRVAADSPDLSVPDECFRHSTTASPTGGPTTASPSGPNCIYKDEEEEAGMVHTVPGLAPSPGNGTDNETSTVGHFETHMVNETESNETLTIAGNVETSSLHPGHMDVDEDTSHDELFTGYSEVETAAPPGAAASGHIATGDSSATADLEKNNAGAGVASSNHHGNVVVLVPVIVPRRNASTALEATAAKEAVAPSNHGEGEVEECEEDENGPGQHFFASNERDSASTRSPESLGGDQPSVGAFPTEGHGSPSNGASVNMNEDHHHIGHSHGTPGENFISSKENDTFATELGNPATTGANTPVGTSNPDRELLVSSGGVGTPRPKIPCKRPGSQSQPGVNLMSSPEAEKREAEEGVALNDAHQRNVPGKTHFPDKTHPYSGAFSLAASFSLFSLSLFLVTLLH